VSSNRHCDTEINSEVWRRLPLTKCGYACCHFYSRNIVRAMPSKLSDEAHQQLQRATYNAQHKHIGDAPAIK
jgi:hypothetical protein